MVATTALDYLVVGHVTRDLVNGSFRIGGTASYATRTARALGLRVAVVTSASGELDLTDVLEGVLIARSPAAQTTTFENVYTPKGRQQMLYASAATLVPAMIPSDWRPAIVHLGPVARECSPELADAFGDAFIGLTPQGWMRDWDPHGHVRQCDWQAPERLLARANAVVFSEMDVLDAELIPRYAAQTRVLVVTRGAAGCTIHTAGRARDLAAPAVKELDPTGAGDIFAAVFFDWLHRTGDPLAAGRLANCLASLSVTRVGLAGTPDPVDVARCQQALV